MFSKTQVCWFCMLVESLLKLQRQGQVIQNSYDFVAKIMSRCNVTS